MGMFDDLIPQAQPEPAAATDVPQESPLDSAGRAMGNAVTMGMAPYMGGALNYATHAGAPGSFDQGYQRSVGASENSQTQNPDAYTGGTMTGMALGAAVPGGMAVNTARRIPGAASAAIQGLGALGVPGLRTIGRALGGVQRARSLSDAMTRAPAQAENSDLVSRLVDALIGQRGAAARSGQGVRSGASPHERVNSLSDAMRSNPRTLTREQYMQRAATYTRRGGSYQHRANTERDYPEGYRPEDWVRLDDITP